MSKSKKLSLKLNKYELLYAAVILSFVPVSYLHRIFPMITSVETVVKLAALCYVLITTLALRGRIRKNYFLLVILAFWGYLFVPTYLHCGDLSAYVQTVWNVPIFILFMVTAFDKRPNQMINAFCGVFCAYILINTITTILFPQGLFETVAMSGIARKEASYFLGHKNIVLSYMMPGILCLCYKNYARKNKLTFTTWLYIIGVCVCCVIGQSLTSMIAVAIVIVSLVMADSKRLSKYINTRTALLMNLLFFIFIVVLRVQEVFSYFLVSVTGKGLDMNGRTLIWDKALLAILQHPMIGYGIEPAKNILSKYMVNSDSFHNLAVDLLYQGGIIGMLLFVAMFYFLDRTIARCPNIRIKNLCNAVIFATSINWMSQPATRARMLLIYIPVLLTVFMCNNQKQSISEYKGKVIQ